MSIRAWLLVVVPVVIVAAAHDARAQAPGDQPGFAAPGCEVVDARPDPVMARRWAIALGVGSTTLAPAGSPDDKAQFSVDVLALRYRATPHLELELEATAGRIRTGADLELHAITANLRYRMRPGHAWDWYLLGGVGDSAIVSVPATTDDRNAATRGELVGGVGVERRFGNFGISAELRAIALAAPNAANTANTATAGESGGSLTIGAAYYF